MWSHDEQREIADGYVAMAILRCPCCEGINKKYVESWDTGRKPCVLIAKYCRFCGSSLERKRYDD